VMILDLLIYKHYLTFVINKGNKKITELQTILQRKGQNS
jgi:hypothetical protein